MPLNVAGIFSGYVGGDISYEIGDMAYLDASTKLGIGQNGFVTVFGSLGFKSQF